MRKLPSPCWPTMQPRARRGSAGMAPCSSFRAAPSSSSARRCRIRHVLELAAAAKAKGLRYIDCPVTGWPHMAAAGELTLLIGADPADLEAARPVLASLCKSIARLRSGRRRHRLQADDQSDGLGADRRVGGGSGVGGAPRARSRGCHRRHRERRRRQPAGRPALPADGGKALRARPGFQHGAAPQGCELRTGVGGDAAACRRRSARPRPTGGCRPRRCIPTPTRRA